jgi:3-oxoacyl-[acyl-carrier protein] reductase
MKGLAGKVVLITGAAGAGIGQATARRCAEEGCAVVVTDIHPGRTEEVARELAAIYDSRIFGLVMDIADRKQVDDVFAQVLERCGRIDVLVNNAAINILAGVAELRPEDWDRVVNVDLSAIYYCMHKALPGMIARKSGYH